MQQEHEIQNAIRLHVSQHGLATLFRGNVGQAYTGNPGDIKKMPDGTVIIKNARPFKSGLPQGWPDLFGFRLTEITSEMVGEELPVFCAIEVKRPGKHPTEVQEQCLKYLQNNNCLAGVATGTEDAERILKGDVAK
ncbi:MAG: VRR-NUC domain-containing protein [Acidaminococcaceae bacterium]